MADFKLAHVQGQLLATARAVLAAHRYDTQKLVRDGTSPDTSEKHCGELRRLIGNQFQFRNDIGEPIQLSCLILLMSGEETELSGL